MSKVKLKQFLAIEDEQLQIVPVLTAINKVNFQRKIIFPACLL
jgi:hypothetical protein